jgi:DNA-binding IclR family transcriptional regulator
MDRVGETEVEIDAAGRVRQRDPLAKALLAIDVLVDHPDGALGVRELAHMLGTAPSTTHRTLSMLAEIGMVARDNDGRYSVGFELQRLAWRVNARFPTLTIAEPVLTKLTEVTSETSVLGLFDPVRNQVTFAATVHTQHRLQYVGNLFHSIAIHAGASGLSILAVLEKPLRDQIVYAPQLEAFTDRTLTDPAQLDAELSRIRRAGYAISRGQRTEGAVGIGAPVWGKETVIGNVMVTIPEQRFDPAKERELADAVISAAAEVTRLMKGRAPLSLD